MTRVLLNAWLAGTITHGQAQSFDIIIDNGTVIDGSGNPRYDALPTGGSLPPAAVRSTGR